MPPAEYAKRKKHITKERVKTVKAAAWIEIEGLLGKAFKVIDRELSDRTTVIVCDATGAPIMKEDGTPQTTMIGASGQTARWLIDKASGHGHGLLLHTIDADMSTMEGVLAAAQKAMEMMLAREMTIADCTKVLELLLKYATVRAFDGMAELRAMLADIENRTINGTSRPAGGAVLPGTPKWGRLTPESETANKTPGE